VFLTPTEQELRVDEGDKDYIYKGNVDVRDSVCQANFNQIRVEVRSLAIKLN